MSACIRKCIFAKNSDRDMQISLCLRDPRACEGVMVEVVEKESSCLFLPTVVPCMIPFSDRDAIWISTVAPALRSK